MKPRDISRPQRVACAVCGKTMQLGRTVTSPAKGERYEFWQCPGCGHSHIRATTTADNRQPARNAS